MTILKFQKIRVRRPWQGAEQLCVNWIFIRNTMKAPKAGCAQAAFLFCEASHVRSAEMFTSFVFLWKFKSGWRIALPCLFVSFVTRQKKVKNIFYKNPIAGGESPCLASDNHRNCFFYVKKKKSLITRPRYNAPRASSAASLDLTLHGELRLLKLFAFEN